MTYNEYLLQISSSKIRVDNEVYSFDEIQDWSREKADEVYIEKVKSVYRCWFDDSSKFELYTSGSTGRPKLIKVSKEKMYHSAISSLSYFGLSTGDRVLLVLPADKVGGIMLIIRSIIGGLELILRKPILTPFLKGNHESFSFCSLTPAQLRASIDNGSDTELLKIEKVLLGGSTVSKDLQKYAEIQNNLFFSSYGMTETLSHVAIQHLNGKAASDFYHAIANVSFRQNEHKCLIIRAPGIIDGEILTNDIVYLKSSTKMKWLGRIDNVVNSGGLKLIPEMLEKKIKDVIPYNFYLCGEEDLSFGERLVLIIETVTLTTEENKKLKAELKSKLSKNERPKILYCTEQFNYTKNRKLIRSKPNQLSVVGYKLT